MIHNDVVNQLQLLVKAVAPPLIEVSDTPLEAPEWVPGQRLPAVVLASLPNGRFQVLVSDHELDMNLPRNTQPGEKLDLVFVSSQPRPTFVLARDLPGQAAMQSQAKLSEAARFLGALLRGEVPAANKEQTAAVTRSTPLLPGPPTNAPELAQQLGKVLVQSGLFYESHQAQWVAGQRPLAELLQEPQGRLSPRLNGEAAHPAAQGFRAETGKEVSNPQLQPNQQADRSALRDPVHPQATTLVQQQLDVLDTRNVVWQGQVWPGQTMQWQIEEREARRDDGEEEGEVREWHTSVRLHLPRIGLVDASLALTTRGVQLKLGAAEQSSVNLMKARYPELEQAMESSGLKILSFEAEMANGQA